MKSVFWGYILLLNLMLLLCTIASGNCRFEAASEGKSCVNLIGLLLCFQVRSKFAMAFHLISK